MFIRRDKFFPTLRYFHMSVSACKALTLFALRQRHSQLTASSNDESCENKEMLREWCESISKETKQR